jgi:hypothetical protein
VPHQGSRLEVGGGVLLHGEGCATQPVEEAHAVELQDAVRLQEQQLRADLCQQRLLRLARGSSSCGPGATYRALQLRLGVA